MTVKAVPAGRSGPAEWLRRLGLAALAGAIAGLVAGGLGGRLFMLLLAQLNPVATGQLSDDGFVMGQFTVAGTLNLLAAGTVFGVVGGLVWVGLRGLRFGPLWWRRVSLPLGATLVIGAVLVNSGGIDFRLLDPPLVAAGLTLSVPLLATVIVTWLGDRWIADDRTVWQRMPAAVAWAARAALTLLALMALLDLAVDISIIQ